MDPSTPKVPRLVNREHFKINQQVVSKPKIKWIDHNIIILGVFLAFFVFFLLNCRSGMFKNIALDPVPYSMVK